MTPRTKVILKILPCYWIASISLMYAMDMFSSTNSHVAFADSPLVMMLFAPFVAMLVVPMMPFGIFDPKIWLGLVAFWVPLFAGLSIVFRRPERWYQFLNRD